MNKKAALAVGGNAVLAGILLMLLGDFMFALNDAMGKWLVASFWSSFVDPLVWCLLCARPDVIAPAGKRIISG